MDPARVEKVVENKDGSVTVEYKKEHYYEEYITSYGEAIKDGQIKYKESRARSVGKLFYPGLKKVFPSWYEKTQAKDYTEIMAGKGINSKKAGEDLHAMIRDMYSLSEIARERTLRKEVKGVEEQAAVRETKVAKAIKEAVKKAEKNLLEGEGTAQSKIKDGFADPRIAEEIGITKESSKKIVEKNESIYKQVLKAAKEAGVQTIKIKREGKTIEMIADPNVAKDFVSQKIKDDLVMNNMARVTALAKDAARKGEGVPGEV